MRDRLVMEGGLMRLALKTAILQRGILQRECARRAKMDPSKVSAIVNGWKDPSPSGRARIAAVLQSQEAIPLPVPRGEAAWQTVCSHHEPSTRSHPPASSAIERVRPGRPALSP